MQHFLWKPGRKQGYACWRDRVLSKHYGFTAEALDFIINYDIKYRMGKGAGGEDE